MSSKSTPPSTTSAGISVIRQALYFPLGLAALYLTFFLGLLTPIFQRHFIFLHAIQYPFFPAYDQPHKYGLAPFKTRNLTFSTSDGERIGAWHILPEIFYQSHLSINTHDHDQEQEQEQWDEEVYDRAMREYPTILYLHGNSMNRAAPFRIAAYSAMTSRMDVNVVAIDYRGFGDSTGVPSEQGLAIDAEAAYGWIRKKQRSSSQSIAVFGQSLGTGIATLVAEKLEQLGTPLKGVVLMAPYTDLKALVKDFKLAGLFPVLAPIGRVMRQVLSYSMQKMIR
uniref:AB hydrolase-1 domain-containing protein n=1 Tax=Melanopsichium pennsylvanicum 4 TaxID=1398559 RepID=A0A077R6V5_9BASI|nr:conserved hypothetical protein [Melanopsichium pennsylvanicum 4]